MVVERKIYVNNDLDIVVARMQAREMAKEMGFSTADQARISLAASELARVVSWNTNERGEIVISGASKSGHQGLQVTCLVRREYIPAGDMSNGGKETPVPNRSLAGARRLVDESTVETQDNKWARVILTKWLKHP
jgi:serine/threonine-protein kinase RsbT